MVHISKQFLNMATRSFGLFYALNEIIFVNVATGFVLLKLLDSTDKKRMNFSRTMDCNMILYVHNIL